MKCPLKNKKFFCREWVFSKISHYLEQRRNSAIRANDSKSPVADGILIVGGPGSGKTAICCEIAWPSVVISLQSELNARLVAYYFCQGFDGVSLEPATFVISLVKQLCNSPLIPAFREKVENDGRIRAWLEAGRCQRFPKESFQRSVLQVLSEIPPPQEPLIVLVDSLHETIDTSGHVRDPEGHKSKEVSSRPHEPDTFLDIIGMAAKHFPPWLLLICTSRRICNPVSQCLVGFRKITLDDLRKSPVVKDVQQYILCRLDAEESLRQQLDLETAEMLNQLHIKSTGCLLYLELVLDGVKNGFIRLREIQHMPCTLNGLFLWLCQRLFVRKQGFYKARLLLDVLLAARQPLTIEQLFDILSNRKRNLSGKEFMEIIDSLDNLLLELSEGSEETQLSSSSQLPSSRGHLRDRLLIIFHPSLSEWLVDVKYCTRKYLCDPVEGHGAIALWHGNRGPELSPSEIIEFAYHLTRSRVDSLFTQTMLPCFLLQSGAPVQELVLNSSAVDELTTRLLMDAGADFVSLGSERPFTPPLVSTDLTEGFGGSSPSGSSGTRSDNEVLADETAVDGEGRAIMHHLAGEGRHSTIRRLLMRGAYCDPEDRLGDTPLCIAARQGHSLAVECLLDGGAEPNHHGADGWTALRCAAWGGHVDTVKQLLKGGAAVDYAGTDRRTPLRAAAWAGHEDVVMCLLDAGAEVDSIDGEGRTALMAAAYMGHTEIVQILMSAGSDPNLTDMDGRTALSVTAVCSSESADHLGVAECLMRGGANVDYRDNSGRTPLFSAALEGHLEMCQLLLEYGADVDRCDIYQNTTLLAAAACGNVSILQLFLDSGAIPDAIDAEGRTVLSVAATQGSPQGVSLLLDRGLDEMHRDNSGWLPIHHAAVEGHTTVCFLLLEHNASTVHETDHEGRHPLILACEEGYDEVVTTLLDFGAPVNLPCVDGRTALRVAAVNNRKTICTTLISRGATVETKDVDSRSILYALITDGNIEMSEFFLTMGTRVHNPDSEGRVPLHVAAWKGDVSATLLLLKYGARIDTPDGEGRTPLMTALWRGHLSIVEALLERKADPNATCSQGATALSIAAQEGNEDAVRLLLRFGADPQHKDRYGRTVAEVALRTGHSRIVEVLTKPSSSLSPRQETPPSNTAHSGGSSAEKTSGFVSNMCSSSESPFTTTPRDNHRRGQQHAPLSPQPTHSVLNNNIYPHNTHTSSSSVGKYADSNRSTLSSCGSPTDEGGEGFAKRLLERSLPRPHSRPLSMRLCATDINLDIGAHPSQPSAQFVQSVHLQHERNLFSNSSSSFVGMSHTMSESSMGRRRPGIATNPKCRKPRNGSQQGRRPNYESATADRTHQDLRKTAAKLQELMRAGHNC